MSASIEDLSDKAATGSVLIVDDSKTMRAAVREILAPMGYTLWEASGGVKAVDIARFRHPNLILLDWVMPGMNGLDVLKQLRDFPETKDIPVCLLTVVKDVAELREAAAYGVTDYLSKPASPKALCAKVEKYCQP